VLIFKVERILKKRGNMKDFVLTTTYVVIIVFSSVVINYSSKLLKKLKKNK